MNPIASSVLLLVLSQANVRDVVGDGRPGDSGDGGPARSARLNQPFGVAFDREGNLYIADTGNHRVRRVDAKSGVIRTVAGSGKKGFSGDGGPASDAMLNEPYGLAVDDAGHLYIADRLNHRIRRVDLRSGTIATVAGGGSLSGEAKEGPATEIGLSDAGGIALDGKGHLYVADVAAHRVWSLDLASGRMRPFAGTGKGKHDPDGPHATEIGFLGPRAVAVGPDGTIYVVERNGNTVRAIDPASLSVATIAGTGAKGRSGDGGPAMGATFDGPKEIAVDREGNLLIVDTENQAIRRIDGRSGVITTLAGPSRQAGLDRPHGVAVGLDGAIVIGDTNHHRVRKIGLP